LAGLEPQSGVTPEGLMGRKIWTAAAIAGIAFLIHCTTEKNRTDSYAPAAQQCVTETDPACVGGASAMASIPLPEKRDKSLPKSETSIFGSCEMLIDGEKVTRPCEGIKLVLQATRENEVREAVFDGSNFKFEDLNQSHYTLQAESNKYEVITEPKTLNRGSTVKVKIKARPRP
jgi:hypothetical protein